MSRYSIFGEKEIVAKSQWVRIYGTDDDTFTYNDKKILTESDLPPPFSVAPVGTTPNAAGLSFAAGVLNGQPADATHPGFVTTLAQTFAGSKQFNDILMVNAPIIGNGTLTVSDNSVLEDITSTSLYSATANTTTPKLLTIGSDGKFSNFTPIYDLAVISFAAGSASTNPASPSTMALSSIAPGNTGITIDLPTNSFIFSKPGMYRMNVGLQLDPPTGFPQLQILLRHRNNPADPWVASQSYQVGGLYQWTGLELPYNFFYSFNKTTSTSTLDYWKFEVIGDCLTAGTDVPNGTAPSWNNFFKACGIQFIASPTVTP